MCEIDLVPNQSELRRINCNWFWEIKYVFPGADDFEGQFFFWAKIDMNHRIGVQCIIFVSAHRIQTYGSD